ncbi:MAG: Na+/H+ antiporter [Chitinophagaceae bacterium]|nr:Na+/H+ antiporter [Chitinophagaceae bacterium]
MQNFGVVIFILAILISLSTVTDKLRLPYPVLLVLAGILIGVIPHLPQLTLDPELIFLVFLPPLLYDAATHASWHEFKTNIRPISALGISLVFFTMTAVALTAHYFIPMFSWPLAFLLGAIVSPPDATAATGIIKGLGLNKQVISILEGESLLNDASALIAYRYALIAATTGNFLFWQAGLQFLLVAGGGIFVGVIAGYGLTVLHKRINNHPLVETSLTLLTPFLSFLLGELVHTSGILAVVSTGLFISRRSPEIFSYQTRIQSRVVWDNLIFLLNGFIFILIGLQLPGVLKQLTNYRLPTLIGYGLLISLTTIFVRILWVFGSAWSFQYYNQRKTKKNLQPATKKADPTWKNVLIVAWTGTRGMISMATALALPLTLYNGTPFPERHLIIFVCFVVIFITLVVQGYSLPLLTRLLGIKASDHQDKEEKQLQLYLVRSTLHFLDKEFGQKLESHVRNTLKIEYDQLAEKLANEIATLKRNEKRREQAPIRTLTDIQKAQTEIGLFQRKILLRLHKDGNISNEVIRQVEREMDIDELKFQQLLPKDAE